MVGKDNGRKRAGRFVRVHKRAPHRRRVLGNGEAVARHLRVRHTLRQAFIIRDVRGRETVRGDAFKRLGACAVVAKIRVRDGPIKGVGVGVGGGDPHDAVDVVEAEVPGERSLDDGKNSGVGTDAEGECDDSHHGEAGG